MATRRSLSFLAFFLALAVAAACFPILIQGQYMDTDLEVDIQVFPANVVTGGSYEVVARITNTNASHSVELKEITLWMNYFSYGSHMEYDMRMLAHVIPSEVDTIISHPLELGESVDVTFSFRIDNWLKARDYNLQLSVEGTNTGTHLSVYGYDVTVMKVSWGIVEILSLIGIITIVSLSISWFVFRKQIRAFVSKRRQNKPTTPTCAACGKKLDVAALRYCQLWESKSRRCKAGPFCSEECLDKHISREAHQ